MDMLPERPLHLALGRLNSKELHRASLACSRWQREAQLMVAFRQCDLRQGCWFYRRRDLDRAEACFVRAARRGCVWSLFCAGVCCEVRNDLGEALRWWWRAHALGSVQATSNLAACYEHGWGAPKNTSLSNLLKGCPWGARKVPGLCPR